MGRHTAFWRRNRRKLIPAFALLSALSYFAYWAVTQELRRTRLYYPTELDFAKIEMALNENFRKGEMGQTENEVRAILGAPHKILTGHEAGEKVWLYKGAKIEEDDFEACYVVFDENGRVRGCGRDLPDKRNIFEKSLGWLKDRLGL